MLRGLGTVRHWYRSGTTLGPGDFPAAALGAPITLTAPAAGGAFRLETALPLP